MSGMAANGGSMVAGPITSAVSGDAILKAFADPAGLKLFAEQAEAIMAQAKGNAAALLDSARADRAAAEQALAQAKQQGERLVADARAQANQIVQTATQRSMAISEEAKRAQLALDKLTADVAKLTRDQRDLQKIVDDAFAGREASVLKREKEVMDARSAADAVAASAAAKLDEARAIRGEYEQKAAALKKLVG